MKIQLNDLKQRKLLADKEEVTKAVEKHIKACTPKVFTISVTVKWWHAFIPWFILERIIKIEPKEL
jgi:hypothetical protein